MGEGTLQHLSSAPGSRRCNFFGVAAADCYAPVRWLIVVSAAVITLYLSLLHVSRFISLPSVFR